MNNYAFPSGAMTISAFRFRRDYDGMATFGLVDAELRWAPVYLVDQFSVLPPAYGMQETPTSGFLSEPATSQYEHKWIRYDLGREYPIDEVRAYPAQSKATYRVGVSVTTCIVRLIELVFPRGR